MTLDENTTYLGYRYIEGDPFGLLQPDRRYHSYVVGKTGTGKSTLLKNLVLQDIHAGRGIGVLDPHGDLALELLDHIPSWRAEDVVYFNPADHEYPIGLNLLTQVAPSQRHLAASGIVGALRGIWRDSWGPRLEYILYAAVAALLECENTTLLGVQRMLTDSRYRDWVVKQIKDPAVRFFWVAEFARYDPRFLQEAIAPIQNKVGQLLMAAPVRNILGQVRRKIDPAFMMDKRRIFIANLAKGTLGEDKSNLLGALLVAQFQQAAMARAHTPEAERQDFHLVIDEFQNFSTAAFAGILSEARKYRLCLTLSHQYVGQLDEEIRDAVFGNAGTVISFRVGERDADILHREFGATYRADQFTELSNFEVLVKLMHNGEQRAPFRGKTLPAWHAHFGRRAKLVRRCRERYATPRPVVEAKIARWMHA